MVQIIHADRRRDQRRPMPPLALRIDDQILRSVDWSLGGVALKGLDGFYGPGDPVAGFLGPTAGEGPWCPFEGIMVRYRHNDGAAALRFVGLSPECFDLLEGLIRHRRPAGRAAVAAS